MRCAGESFVANSTLVVVSRGKASSPVGGPGFGQVELPVDRRVPGTGSVGEERPDLAVLHPTHGPRALALHARRVPLLQEAGAVDDQHP